MRQVLRIFAWTAAALMDIAPLSRLTDQQAVRAGQPLGNAGARRAVGLISESGSHLVFMTLYAADTVSMSVLVTSSRVKDGDGILPFLARSRRNSCV